jgi:ATP-binding cassette subfamily B protein
VFARAFRLVWSTSRSLTLAFVLLTVVAGILPAAIAYIGAQIVDAVVAASRSWPSGAGFDLAALRAHPQAATVLELVLQEGVLVAALAAVQRALSFCQSLLRAQLGQRVNVMILEKALTLSLAQFEDSEFYDKLTRARREASSRPLALVIKAFGLLQNGISLASFAALLIAFSPWAVAVLLLAGLPAFIAETKFSGDAFRLFKWRSPETRMQLYLETVLAREDHAKEVKLYGLGERLLQRYRDIFARLYRGSRADSASRQLGFCTGSVRHRRAVWRLCLDCTRGGRRSHHAWPDDDVPDAVSSGSVGCVGRSVGDRRYV